MSEHKQDNAQVKPTGKRQRDGKQTFSTSSTAVSKRAKTTVDRDERPGGGVKTFFPEVASEMKKVIWPTGREMVTYTAIVFIFLILVTALVWGIDTLAGWGVEKIFIR